MAQEKPIFHEKIIPYNRDLRERAKTLRKVGTLGEVLIWTKLKGKQCDGEDFDRQRIIGNYIVDFYCKRLRLAIEIDGASHADRGDYDQNRTQFLEEYGIQVLRFREEDVYNDLEQILVSISSAIHDLRRTVTQPPHIEATR